MYTLICENTKAGVSGPEMEIWYAKYQPLLDCLQNRNDLILFTFKIKIKIKSIFISI